MAYNVESTDKGVFITTTNTRYNAEGNPLVSMQKSLISNLSDVIESINLTIDERNLTSTQWVEYHVGTKRKSYNALPTSDITAEAVTVDGFTLSQTDNAGVTTTNGRSYTATGMIQTRTDGRGNTITTVTDAAGNATTTVYDSAHDLPATVTDAQGNTTCYRYDARGRKLVEWGTGIQPVCFGYDDADRMVTLTTFRDGTESGNTWQPIQWSSEYSDIELGLVYYNYRHYNPLDGRWIARDQLSEEAGFKLYSIVKGLITYTTDLLGCIFEKSIRCSSRYPKATVR